MYHTLLGIEWYFDKFSIIDLKREKMTFEVDGTRVIKPLNSYQGSRYVPLEGVMERDVLDCICCMIAIKGFTMSTI